MSVLSEDQVNRTRAAIGRLGRAGLGLDAFSREALQQVRRVVPFEGYCWTTTDPITLLPTWAIVEDAAPGSDLKRFWELEFDAAEAVSHFSLVRHPTHVSTLSWATGGDPARSPRWEELLRPGGVRDELRVACVLDGICWGKFTLFRERCSRDFSSDEARLLSQLSVAVAAGLRAGLVSEPPRFEEAAEGPGLVLLGPDLKPVASTPQGARWLACVGPPNPDLPSQVYGLVAYLRALEVANPESDPLARTRVRLGDGRWLALHAARLAGGAAGQLAIVLEPAGPADLAPLLAGGYGLSARERAVAEQVLLGRSTAQISRALGITPYTVRDHLKAIFAKVGVRSRRELGQALSATTSSLRVN